MTPLELLSRSWTLYKTYVWFLVGYAAWMILPISALFLLTFVEEGWLVFVLTFFVMLAGLILGLWVTIALVRSIHQLSQKTEISPAKISQEATKRLLVLAQTAVLHSLIIVGGLLLLIVPGLVFGVWYAFAQLATILDDKRPVEALSFSRTLTQGRFWQVAWYLVSGPIFLLIVYTVLMAALLLLIATLTGIDPSLLFGDQPPDWAVLVEAIGEIFLIPLILTYSVLLYQELKKPTAKPGLDKSCEVT